MKIMRKNIGLPDQSTLKLKFGDSPFLIHPWHYHSEYQIIYLPESTGIRFVASHIEPYGPGDMVMVGGNLPHFWQNEDCSYSEGSLLRTNRIVVQFPHDFLKPNIETYPEFQSIRNLLLRSEKGIRFLPPHNVEIGEMLLDLPGLSGLRQIIRFIEILDHMAQITNYKLLASDAFQPTRLDISDNRLIKVMRFLTYKHQKQISLEEVAEIAGMHPTAFCRYFKDKTGKQLSVYLNELRIGFSCKLLIKGTMQVSQVCYETGFNNLSNFNRIFKSVTGLTPTQIGRASCRERV